MYQKSDGRKLIELILQSARPPSRALRTDQFKWLKVSSEFIEADENLHTSTETSTEASTRLTLPSLCSEKFNFCSQDKTYVG